MKCAVRSMVLRPDSRRSDERRRTEDCGCRRLVRHQRCARTVVGPQHEIVCGRVAWCVAVPRGAGETTLTGNVRESNDSANHQRPATRIRRCRESSSDCFGRWTKPARFTGWSPSSGGGSYRRKKTMAFADRSFLAKQNAAGSESGEAQTASRCARYSAAFRVAQSGIASVRMKS
jgi:hypothetical protein